MTDQLTALTTIFTEFYYWITVVLMFLIHVGFCMYEVGASRGSNFIHTETYVDQKHKYHCYPVVELCKYGSQCCKLISHCLPPLLC